MKTLPAQSWFDEKERARSLDTIRSDIGDKSLPQKLGDVPMVRNKSFRGS